MSNASTTNSEPSITRVPHELTRRQLTVARVDALGNKMRRITLTGEELKGFTSLGFDDHIKLFFPAATTEPDNSAPSMRDFTPRRFDAAARELTIDFFLHEAGPAATWAAQAAAGQTLSIGGPKGSAIISVEGIDAHLLIGDETALPAIGRRLEELPATTRALVIVEADVEADGKGAYPLTSAADLQVVWAPRDHRFTQPGEQLIETLRNVQFVTKQCFAWVATETHAARAIRRYLTEERSFDKA